MGDFTFSCPHCKQSLEASDEMRGQLVDCPTCKKPIEIPHSYPPIQQPKPVPPYITPIASGIFTRLLAWWLTRPIFVRTISAFGTLLFLVFSGFAFYEGYFGIGVLCLVAGGVNLLAAPLGWLIGDKFRQYAMPSFYFAKGAVDLAKKRFFWTHGPQLIGVAIVFLILFAVSRAPFLFIRTPVSKSSITYQPPVVKARPAQGKPSEVKTDHIPEIFLSPKAKVAGVTFEFRVDKKYLLVKTHQDVGVVVVFENWPYSYNCGTSAFSVPGDLNFLGQEHNPLREQHPDGIGFLYEMKPKNHDWIVYKEFFIYLDGGLSTSDQNPFNDLWQIHKAALEKAERFRKKQELGEMTETEVRQAIQDLIPEMRAERLKVYQKY